MKGTFVRAVGPVLACVLASCGGGGGATGEPSLVPPSINDTAVSWAAGDFGACTIDDIHVDDRGELAAFWCEVDAGGASRLMAARQVPGSRTALIGTAGPALSSGTIANSVFSTRRLRDQRYVLVHKNGGLPDTTFARVIDLSGPVPDAAADVFLPADIDPLSRLGLVQDSTGAMHALGFFAAGSVTDLGRGETFTVVSLAGTPFSANFQQVASGASGPSQAL